MENIVILMNCEICLESSACAMGLRETCVLEEERKRNKRNHEVTRR